ncbi:MAG: hypothetical protein J6X81_03640 [Muribaculaceae bacterium]|nr:hypothetical protein [Muribaculaceae bacterium]
MKRFLTKIAVWVLPVWLVWVLACAYFVFYINPNATGDLAVVGHLPLDRSNSFYPDNSNHIPTYYREIYDPDSLRLQDSTLVLVVGDSFSQRKQNSFQNYLARDGFNVANVVPQNLNYFNPLQCAAELLAFHGIDSTCCRVMIVETGERYLPLRLQSFNPDVTAPTAKIRKKPAPATQAATSSPMLLNPLISTRDMLFCRLGITKPVLRAELKKPLFTSDLSTTLFFFHEDVDMDMSLPPSEQLKGKIHLLRTLARERGVKLIFLLAPDKYDLYQDFIVSNPYPRKTVCEDFRALVGEDSCFIVAKELLLPLLQRGEKDVFIADDTHWSCQTAEFVAAHIKKVIQ